MATRSGSVDPGLLTWLLERTGMAERELSEALEHNSGLLGLAGSADMREVVRRAADGDEHASLALDVYVHRLRAGIAAMAAALGGLDVIAFTGGVGERSAEVRARAAAGLGFLGMRIDQRVNADVTPDAEVTAPESAVRTLVIRAREDLEIARQTRAAAASGEGGHDPATWSA
jgi:acetate kinase